MMLKLKNNLPVIVLIIIAIFLCIKNYTPGTFLSGWDTLHPEFNFGLNLKREIFGVFRNEQGLGAVAAHSHMADLPRLAVLYIFHFFFSVNLLRYLYIFLNLIIGPLGMYFFLNRIVLKNRAGAFLGGLFYLLNLGTIQQFIVPFEMFVTQYGLLPWIFLFATEYLFSKKSGNRKALLLFSIATIFAAPMAYAATLWYTYFFTFILYLLALSLPSVLKKDISFLKKSIVLVVLTLLINSFWILPNIYFVLTQGANVQKASINVLFSPQAFLYNKEFGNLKDIALLKTFLFDWGVYTGGNHFSNLLQPFINHLNKPFVSPIGYLFAFTSLVGLAYSVYKKERFGLSILPILIFALFFLINDNPPTSFFYNFLALKIPLFQEAFRFPDDKVLGLFIFAFTIYFAFGQMAVINLISKITKKLKNYLIYLQLTTVTLLLFYFMLPAFRGFLISPYMRVGIPSSYFEMFSWFNNQKDEGRIANFPIHSPWGWEYYDWYKDKPSFQGAGFVSFGIKQPLLSRDFDRWNPYNEQYYREMSYALYSENKELIKEVIEKYNIHYIILDKNIIAPENDQRVLYYKQTQNMLDSLGDEKFIQKKAQFGDNLKIYQVARPSPAYAYFVKNFTSVSPAAAAYTQDFAFGKFKDYVIDNSDLSAHYYPFRSITDAQNHVLLPLEETQEGIKISLNKNSAGTAMPSFIENENSIASDLFVQRQNNNLTATFYPRLPQKNTDQSSIPIAISLSLPKDNVVLSVNNVYNFVLDEIPNNTPLSLGSVFLKTKDGNTITIYPKTPNQVVIPDFSNLQFSLASCEGQNASQVVGITKERNSFVLFGQKTPVCMLIPLANLIPNLRNGNSGERYLLSAGFEYAGKPFSYLCIASTKNGACLNYNLKNITSAQLSGNPKYFEIKQENIEDLGIKIVLDATQNKSETAAYSNVVFTLAKPFSASSFSQDIIEESIKPVSTALSNTFVLPFSGSQDLSKNITTLPKTTIECSQSSPVNHKISKRIISQEKQSFIEYVADEGVACDHFSYQNLPQDQGYLIAITSRNVKGLPLTMCVLNQTSKHCDLYANLAKSSNFTKEFFLLPPTHTQQKPLPQGQGYDIDIASLGIKYSASINDLQSIELIPFPYRFLSQIQIDKVGQEKLPNSNLLVSSQSYNSGWRAYDIKLKAQDSKAKSLPVQFLPFIFGKELKNHVLVNNWENGWILPNDKPQTTNDQIIIVYLPQYLEYLGIIALAMTFILLAIPKNLFP